MVCINTHNRVTRNKLKITHFVSLNNSHCVFATAREEFTNRTKVFLVNKGKVYFREAIGDGWLQERRASVYELIEAALLDSGIPHYSTSNN